MGIDYNYGFTGKEGTCLWCGHKLTKHYENQYEDVRLPIPKKSPCCKAELTDLDSYGQVFCRACERRVKIDGRKLVGRTYKYSGLDYYGFFHSQVCATNFANQAAKGGFRFKPAAPQPAIKQTSHDDDDE